MSKHSFNIFLIPKQSFEMGSKLAILLACEGGCLSSWDVVGCTDIGWVGVSFARGDLFLGVRVDLGVFD